MVGTFRIEEPPVLKLATPGEARWAVPFTFEVGEHRHRSIDSRGLQIRYKPRPDDPSPASTLGGFSPFDWHRQQPTTPASASATRPDAGHGGATVAAPSGPASRPPSDSYLEIVYPFSSTHILREQYRRFFSERLRFGLLLEDLDSLAGDIAARHAGFEGRVLLTASIDRLAWLRQLQHAELTLAHDLRMAGQVVWAGRSSMEVQIDVSCKEPGDASWRFIGFAVFVLVARTPDRTAAAEVPLLVPQTRREVEMFEAGQVHMAARQQRRESDLVHKPPSAEEVALIHNMTRGIGGLGGAAAGGGHHGARGVAASGVGRGPHAPPPNPRDSVPMQRTALQSSCLMHSQDRNSFDVIFGGHLLRLAYEHAFATAAKHAGEYCEPLSMEDIAFLLPVPIGSLLRLKGQVVFVEGPVVRVHVRASKMEPGAPEQAVVTNVFSFAFLARSGHVKPVLPETLLQALELLQAVRQHRRDEASQAVAREVEAEEAEGVAPEALRPRL